MRNFLLFLVVSISVVSQAQKTQIGVYFNLDLPNREIMPQMSPVLGLGISAAYRPSLRLPLFIELKGGMGNYSYKTLSQTYVFSNSDQTTVDVNYSSSMHHFLMGTKIQLGNEYKRINAFVTPQIGAAFFNSRIYIEDPTTAEGECKALENRVPQRDKIGVYGGEIGVQLNLSGIFKGEVSDYKHRLNLSFNYLAGFKKAEYLNVRYMSDEVHPATTEPNGMHSDENREITTTFINLSSNVTHQHKIGELYESSVQFWGIKIGYVYLF